MAGNNLDSGSSGRLGLLPQPISLSNEPVSIGVSNALGREGMETQVITDDVPTTKYSLQETLAHN